MLDIDNERGEVDDLTAQHQLDCICDDCIDDLLIQRLEDRAA